MSDQTVACILVHPLVQHFPNGLEKVKDAMRSSFNSGTYPTRGEPNGGVPNYIYQIDVIEDKNEGKRSKKPSEYNIKCERKPKKINKLADDAGDLSDNVV